MEPLAYLYLAQEYESSEIQELVWLKSLGQMLARVALKDTGKATVGLFSTVSAAWVLGTATGAQALGTYAGLQTEECAPEECVSQENCIPEQEQCDAKGFIQVILANRYFKTYAGGSYYYILEDRAFDPSPALAVPESSYTSSSYHPVRPEPAPSQPLCGVFKLGDSGSGVACLQELLQKAGYFDGAITGYFGQITCDAVLAFQRDHGLYMDGVAGPQTLEVLNQIAGLT